MTAVPPAAMVLIAGTGTEVGKTWVMAQLARDLRARGRAVAARKPAQSFDPGDDAAHRTDAHILAGATAEDPATVCPPVRWYPRALAPPMAASALGRPPFTITELLAELAASLAGVAPEVVLVESAGGVRSPLAGDGDTVALATALRPALVVLVADAELGTINAVRLSVDSLAANVGPELQVIVFLNRFEPSNPLHAANAAWLRDRDRLRCTTDVHQLASIVDGVRSRPLQWSRGSGGEGTWPRPRSDAPAALHPERSGTDGTW